MPITIRPSVVKIKKPSTGEYREINALLDTDSAKTVYYGVSSTAAATQTKTVTIEGISDLSDGLLVRILFVNAQSYSGVPKLMINSTAASNIKTRRGTDATNLTWKAGDVLDFVYDSSSSGFIVLDKGDIEDLNAAITNEKERVIMLADAIQIAANTNFNTLTTYGNYYVAMTSEAATMPNIPIQRAGRLIVRATISDGTAYVGQIFIPYFGAMAYFRDTHDNGATWSNWETFSNLRGEMVEYLEPKMQASRAYAAGSYLDYGGTLYKAKTAISNGDALTVGTNVDATTVCAELLTKLDKTFTKRTATLNTNYLTSGGLIEYYEIGNLVVVMGKDIAFSQVIPNSNEGNQINLIVGNLPASADNNVFLATYMADLGSTRVTQRMRISQAGQLTAWWHTSVVTTTNTCFFTVIYRKA